MSHLGGRNPSRAPSVSVGEEAEILVVPAVVVVLGVIMTACATPPSESAAEMPIIVDSARFPDVAIQCGGEPGLSGDDCRAWADEMLAGTPTPPSGSQDVTVVELVLTYRTGDSRCAADYFAADGRLVMTAAAHCPFPRTPSD